MPAEMKVGGEGHSYSSEGLTSGMPGKALLRDAALGPPGPLWGREQLCSLLGKPLSQLLLPSEALGAPGSQLDHSLKACGEGRKPGIHVFVGKWVNIKNNSLAASFSLSVSLCLHYISVSPCLISPTHIYT